MECNLAEEVQSRCRFGPLLQLREFRVQGASPCQISSNLGHKFVRMVKEEMVDINRVACGT